MKAILLMIGMALFLGGISAISAEKKQGTEYKQGWEDGFCEGWKDVKGQYAYCAYPPYCPYPEYNCSKGYRCGYNRGFKAGRRAALRNR